MIQTIRDYLFGRQAQAKLRFDALRTGKLRAGEVSDEEVQQAIQSVPKHFGMNKLLLPEFAFTNRLTHWLFDDFDDYTDTQRWTKLAADAGSAVANADGVDGLLTITTGAVDNDEAMVKSTRKTFLFANNKPMISEFRINYAEAATNVANVAAGFSTVFAANLLLDNGAGPATTQDGALIYKKDGETVWRAFCSLGTAQQDTKSLTTAGGTADQVLRIEVMFVTATICEVTYYVDGAQLMDAVQSRPTPIKHSLTYTGAALMGVGAYVKAGSAVVQVGNLDYVFAAQTRT